MTPRVEQQSEEETRRPILSGVAIRHRARILARSALMFALEEDDRFARSLRLVPTTAPATLSTVLRRPPPVCKVTGLECSSAYLRRCALLNDVGRTSSFMSGIPSWGFARPTANPKHCPVVSYVVKDVGVKRLF
jgi:hypothetical protein